jgi:GNAT superfamily N-acetyltransferase
VKPAPSARSTSSFLPKKSWVEAITHQFRPAHPSERKALEELQRRASLKWDEARPEQVQSPRALELPAEQIAAGLVIVYEHWGAPAGFAVVVPRDDGNAEIDGPFVEPDLWRGGIGRKLVEEAAQFAIAIDAGLLLATANARSAPFYAKCGFVPAGVANTRYGPASVMSRSLVF